MSRASVKAAGRSAKTAAAARKKAGKSARKSVKKASASANRRASGKSTRPQRTASAARKPAVRKAASPVTKPAVTKAAVSKAAVAKTAVVKTTVAATVKAVVTPSVAAIAAETMMIRTISPPMQPAAPEVPVYPHKYRIGEVVYYTSPSFGRAAASGSYTVVKLLPSDGDDYQYRIKSSGEAFERVAKESQLDRA